MAAPRELDFVRLLKDIDGWPAGTKGTVVAEWPGGSLIEVDTEPTEADFRGITPEEAARGVEGTGINDVLVDAYHHEVEIIEPYVARRV